MANNVQKYELTQNGHQYILTTKVEQELLKLICIEKGITNSPKFIGEFSLEHLKQLSTLFSTISTINEALEFLNQTIETQKVGVEPYGNIINIILYLSKDSESEKYTIKIGLNSSDVIYKDPILYNSYVKGPISPTKYLPNKIIETKPEVIDQSSYSHLGLHVRNNSSPIINKSSTFINKNSTLLNIGTPVITSSFPSETIKTQKTYTSSIEKNYDNNQNFENYQGGENYQNVFGSYQNVDNYQNIDDYLKNDNYQIADNYQNVDSNQNIDNYLNVDNYDKDGNYQNVETSQNYDDYSIYNQIESASYNNSTSVTPTIETLNIPYSQPKKENNSFYQTKYQTEQYFTPNSTKLPYTTSIMGQPEILFSSPVSSPKREQIQYIIPGSPSTAEITYTAAPSHKDNDYLQKKNIIETTKTTTIRQSPNIDVSLYNQRINSLQNETNKIRGDYNLLKNESNRLNIEVGNLKRQIQILTEENRALKQKNTTVLNETQINEINLLKQENEKLKKQLTQLIGIQNTFEQYKKLKEEEIKFLKSQNEELLKNQKKFFDMSSKQKEIDELKSQNRKMFKSYSDLENKYLSQQHQQIGNQSLKSTSLTVLNTGLKIVKGDIIKSSEELEMLTRKICKGHKKVILDLLYKATIDTDKASAFHKKCDWADKTLVLVKSGNGKRFGGYTTVNWKGDSIEKKDENAFVFSLDKMKIYDIIPGEDAIGCYPKYGPVFFGCQIRIYDEFFSKGGSTYKKGLNYKTEEDYELSGGLKRFNVKEIEVYSVLLE